MTLSVRRQLARSFETGKLEQALRPFDPCSTAEPSEKPAAAEERPQRNRRLEKEADAYDPRAAALFVAGVLVIVAVIALG